MVGVSRRRAIFGGAALGLSGVTGKAYADSGDARLLALGHQLDRLARRVRRLRRHVVPGGDGSGWLRWSRAVSECAHLCERIAAEPAEGIAGLAVRYRGLLWELIEDDLITDRAVRRRVIRFGQDLGNLANATHGEAKNVRSRPRAGLPERTKP